MDQKKKLVDGSAREMQPMFIARVSNGESLTTTKNGRFKSLRTFEAQAKARARQIFRRNYASTIVVRICNYNCDCCFRRRAACCGDERSTLQPTRLVKFLTSATWRHNARSDAAIRASRRQSRDVDRPADANSRKRWRQVRRLVAAVFRSQLWPRQIMEKINTQFCLFFFG